MDKATAIRNCLISRIESCPEGARLPSARKLAQESGVSFQFVQRVVDDLADRGLICIQPRSGMTSHPQWKNRILNGVFRLSNNTLACDELRDFCRAAMPELHISEHFNASNLELRVTHDLLSHHNSYRDLSQMLKKIVPDTAQLSEKILDAGRFGDTLCGVPVCFSPKVVALNKRLFSRCNCPLPPENWTWQDCLDTISRLEKSLEPFRTFGTHSALSEWINFVTVNGGSLYDPADSADPVKLDSPETLGALEFFHSLYNRLKTPENLTKYNHTEDFNAGNIAMYQIVRQGLSSVYNAGVLKKEEIELRVLPVPRAGMVPRSMLGAAFFCVRCGTPDLKQAERLLTRLLSPECQKIFARVHSGIPVLQSAAREIFDSSDSHDAVFAAALPHAVLRYDIPDPASYALICGGVRKAFELPRSKFTREIRRIADALRLLKEFNTNDTVF